MWLSWTSWHSVDEGLLKVTAPSTGQRIRGHLAQSGSRCPANGVSCNSAAYAGRKDRIRMSASYPQGSNSPLAPHQPPGFFRNRAHGHHAGTWRQLYFPLSGRGCVWQAAHRFAGRVATEQSPKFSGVFFTNAAGEYGVEATLPKSGMTARARVVVRAMQTALPEEAMQKLSSLCFKEAEAHFMARRYTEASKFYMEAEQYGLRTADLYLHRAHSHQATGKLAQAVSDYQSVLRLCSNRIRPWFTRRWRKPIAASKSGRRPWPPTAKPVPVSRNALSYTWRKLPSICSKKIGKWQRP